jgi:hypothetical protein
MVLQKGNRLSLGILSLFVLLCIVVLVMPGLSETSYANNTTYYVDSAAGNDTNSGTSTGSPWKNLSKVNATTFLPGDKILFKSGSTWTGQLHPLGSGASGAPISIDRYGTGNRPVINGGGISGLTAGAVVCLNNQQYWEIRGLEITNNAASAAERFGVKVEAQDVGTYNHIYIQDLYIHDIKGNNDNDTYKLNGGILIRMNGTTVKSHWNDVKIEDNTLVRTDRTGISNASSWGNNNGSANFEPYTNLVIRNNNINDVGGDGIVMRSSLNGLVENNIVSKARQRNFGSDVAIWAKDSTNPVMQFNEAYLTKGTSDGQGFDCDFNITGCTVQYNYSHDNEGGFLLMMTNGDIHNDNAVVRYNISQNDKSRIIQFHGSPGPIPSNFKVYNNTFYIGSGLSTAIVKNDSTGTQASNMTWKNNIVYNLGSGGYSPIGVYDYNLFYGNHPASEPSDAHKLISDPLLAGPGTGGIGLGTVNGYKLQTGSPALGSGVLVSSNGGRDYWNNAVSSSTAPSRGAYNGAGVAAPPPGGTVDNNSPSITYTGTWTHSTDALFYNSTKSVSNVTNSTATLNLTGSTIEIYGKKLPAGGKFQVYIDGVLDSSGDTYNAADQYQVLLYQKTGLSNTAHTIQIKLAGQKNASSTGYWIGLDKFVSTSSPPGGTLDNSSPSITYAGTWTHASDTLYYNSTKSVTNITNSTATFSITGTSVKAYGKKLPAGGKFEVYIDGVLDSSGDTYNPTDQYQVLLYQKTGLSNTTHTVQVKLAGQKNASSTGYWIGLDYFSN